jgi:hypothetical protein
MSFRTTLKCPMSDPTKTPSNPNSMSSEANGNEIVCHLVTVLTCFARYSFYGSTLQDFSINIRTILNLDLFSQPRIKILNQFTHHLLTN